MQERERATTTNNKQQTIICIEPLLPKPSGLTLSLSGPCPKDHPKPLRPQAVLCLEARTGAEGLMGCCPHRSASKEDGELSADRGGSDSTESSCLDGSASEEDGEPPADCGGRDDTESRSPEEAAWPGSPTPPPAWVSRLQQQVEFERGRAAWAAGRDEASWAGPTLPPFHLSRRWLQGYTDPPRFNSRDPTLPYEDHRGTVDPTWIPQ